MSLPLVPNMYLYIGEGSIITVTNSILLICILGGTNNRKRREFLLIAAQAISDYFYALAFMLMAFHRLNLVSQGKENSQLPVWDCATLVALPLHDLATPLLGLLPMTSSLNFLLCSLFPLWYMRAGVGYTVVLLAVPHFIMAIFVIVNYILIWGDHTMISAQCVAAKGAAHHYIYGIMLVTRMVTVAGSAIVYASSLIYLKRSQSRSLQELSPQQKKLHMNAKITLGMVTLNAVLLLFIPDVLLFFNPFNIIVGYSTLLYSMTLSKTMINFFIYMWRYRELRLIVLRAVFGKFACSQRHLLSSMADRPDSRWVSTTTGTSTASRNIMDRKPSRVAPEIPRSQPVRNQPTLQPAQVLPVPVQNTDNRSTRRESEGMNRITVELELERESTPIPEEIAPIENSIAESVTLPSSPVTVPPTLNNEDEYDSQVDDQYCSGSLPSTTPPSRLDCDFERNPMGDVPKTEISEPSTLNIKGEPNLAPVEQEPKLIEEEISQPEISTSLYWTWPELPQQHGCESIPFADKRPMFRMIPKGRKNS